MGGKIYSPPEHQDKGIQKMKQKARDREEHFDGKTNRKIIIFSILPFYFLSRTLCNLSRLEFQPSIMPLLIIASACFFIGGNG